MESHTFVAEIYRRMALRRNLAPPKLPEESRVRAVMKEYAPHLPADKSSPILDIGFGDGWFSLACRRLGYSEVHGADFGVERKAHLRDLGVTLHEIETDIGSFLEDQPERYGFIHLSHVIEHIPKYSLLWVVDGLYRALKQGGTLFLRTPNMEGPAAHSAYFVTLSHEYGFAGSNLESLLEICGFDRIAFHAPPKAPTAKGCIGDLLRWPFLLENSLRTRLFGVNSGGQFGPELVATAVRGSYPPLFDRKFR